MPYIHISEASVRNDAEAAEIIRSVSEAYAVASNTPLERVWVVLDPVPRTHWGTGGKALAERDRAAEEQR